MGMGSKNLVIKREKEKYLYVYVLCRNKSGGVIQFMSMLAGLSALGSFDSRASSVDNFIKIREKRLNLISRT